MLPTPSTSHVTFDTIYEPAEDSFLLLDTLSSPGETKWLHSRFRCGSTRQPARELIHHNPQRNPFPLVVELGTGSGVVIAFLAAHAELIFGSPVITLGVDVNPDACEATDETMRRTLDEQRQQDQHSQLNNGTESIHLGSLTADLASCLLDGCVDVLAFNPPYVPTESVPPLSVHDDLHRAEEKGEVMETAFGRDDHLLSLSYAGGKDGMEVANRCLEWLPSILSTRGVAYLLLCAQNRPEEVKRRISGWGVGDKVGERSRAESVWKAETVGRSGKKAGWEVLEVVRIWRE